MTTGENFKKADSEFILDFTNMISLFHFGGAVLVPFIFFGSEIVCANLVAIGDFLVEPGRLHSLRCRWSDGCSWSWRGDKGQFSDREPPELRSMGQVWSKIWVHKRHFSICSRLRNLHSLCKIDRSFVLRSHADDVDDTFLLELPNRLN